MIIDQLKHFARNNLLFSLSCRTMEGDTTKLGAKLKEVGAI